jgi:Caspase domain
VHDGWVRHLMPKGDRCRRRSRVEVTPSRDALSRSLIFRLVHASETSEEKSRFVKVLSDNCLCTHLKYSSPVPRVEKRCHSRRGRHAPVAMWCLPVVVSMSRAGYILSNAYYRALLADTMTVRMALLIAVPDCDNDLLPAISDVVATDIRRMTEALAQSGYQIRHCGAGDPAGREPTGNRIRAAILAALREAPADSVLVIYFSGHGVVVNGRSWLVPQDVYEADNGPDPESLVSLVPADLGGCAAKLVLFLVDACRNDLSGSLATFPGGGTLPYPPDGAFVLVNSCQPGERSTYGDDGSYFTQALAEVLDRRYSARTLDEVYDATVRSLARRTARTDGPLQRPDFVYAQRGMSRAELGAVVVCDGDRVGEAWRRAVESAPIWDRADIDAAHLDRIRRAVLGVVDACAQQWLDSRALLSARADLVDVWSAQDYPPRVLAALDQCLPPGTPLTPFELAAAVSVPFLREVALSAGLRLAAGVRPQDFSRTYHDGARSDLEITHAMHEHVCRRAEGLGRRGRLESRDALAMWLVHRWLAGRSSLRDDAAATALRARIAAAVAPAYPDLTEREMSAHLGVLIQCVDGDADDERLVERLTTHVFDARIRALGSMLWLAGVMAADPRHMPSVVVDHVGIGTELPIATLQAATVKTTWRPTGEGITLQAVCEHPALHAAFSALVRRANDVRRKLHSVELDPALSGGLPIAFSDSGVRAEISDGSPVFDTPLLHFRLSDEKVRELLMGRQLYGEPDLAIRELYQNALDACRYRRTRREYRRRTKQPVTVWDSAIVLRQGCDEDGREYIECIDNGVGMSREILMSTFANAGERFVYRPSFRAEQTRWQELDPPIRLIPNSQFGVGVFSYFMIAEEVLIATRPVGVDDVVAAQASTVRIASSGSLFQITASTEMPGGGTRVRLYLTGEDRISVLRTMRRLLWLAEFKVEVSEVGGSREVWQPEQLRYPGATVEPLKFGEDLWWVPDDGGLAADGLRTNEERYGLVVNLRGLRRPQFTVDRNRLRTWDKEWINRQVRDSLSQLQEWSGLTLSWLWKVTETTPGVAEEVFNWLVNHGRDMPIEVSWAHSAPPSAARVGCLPVDRELFTGEMLGPVYDSSNLWLVCWRVGVWKGILTFIGVENVPEVIRLDGFPVVRPRDASVIDQIYEAGNRYMRPGRYGHPSMDELLEAAADDEESPAVRFRRLRRYAITGLDLSALQNIPPVHHVFKEDNGPAEDGVENPALLSAIAAWAPPGQPRRRAIGGWLGQSSSELHVPLGEVLRRAAALVPPTWVGPRVDDLGSLCDEVFTWNDVQAFSLRQYSGPPWIPSIVVPAHVMRLSATLGRDVSDVLVMFDRFAPLGYEVAGRHLYPGELSNVEREAMRYAEEMGFALTSLHLLVLAGRAETTVREVRSGLERLTRAGFLRLPAEDPIPDATPTEDERSIINESMLVYDARDAGQSLATDWLAVRCLVREIGPRELAGYDERLDRHRRLLDVVDIRRPVTTPEIIDIAYHLDCTVAEAVNYYKQLYPDTADLSALPGDAFTSSAQCRRYEERTALITEPWSFNCGDRTTTWRCTACDIVRGAQMSRQTVNAYLAALQPFRALGAPLPVLSSADQQALADRVADRYDVAMLSYVDGSGQVKAVTEVGPLWLIQVAGRFGWTVAEARHRMARLKPLGLVVNCPAPHCPDEVVCWQDLLAVTVNLDGQEPVLSGTVGIDHLAAASAEIEETVAAVRSRLSKYAHLFGFSLEQSASDTGEETVVV